MLLVDGRLVFCENSFEHCLVGIFDIEVPHVGEVMLLLFVLAFNIVIVNGVPEGLGNFGIYERLDFD
jgi:hypothetical protein